MSEEDQVQFAEETGHKTRKKDRQTDLEGGEVEVAEGFELEGSRVKQLYEWCKRFAKHIPDLQHIDENVITIAISNKEKRVIGSSKKRENIHVFAECLKVRPVLIAIADPKLTPFVITVYPPFWKEQASRQEQIVIHELYHIKPPNENTGKMGMRPHWGFGDNDIEKLHRLIKN